MTDVTRPLRRDAERNRQRLLATARALIAERGLDVTHEEIARGAEVGVGTIYRHFPSKQDLIDALFNQHIDTVVTLAQDARQAADPWAGLLRFMELTLEMRARDRGLSQLLGRGSPESHLIGRARQRITPIIGELVERAQTAGQLAKNVTPGDFVLVELMVVGVMDAARSSDPGLWRRSLAIALAGLTAAEPLPGPSPDDRTIERLHGGETGRPSQ